MADIRENEGIWGSWFTGSYQKPQTRKDMEDTLREAGEASRKSIDKDVQAFSKSLVAVRNDNPAKDCFGNSLQAVYFVSCEKKLVKVNARFLTDAGISVDGLPIGCIEEDRFFDERGTVLTVKEKTEGRPVIAIFENC